MEYDEMLVLEERNRLHNLVEASYADFLEASKPALVEKTVTNMQGEEEVVTVVDYDLFSPEQREYFDRMEGYYKESVAKEYVFRQFLRENGIDNSNSRDIMPFDDVTISATDAVIGKGVGEPTRTFIDVGKKSVECPRKMTLEEYSKIYNQNMGENLGIHSGYNMESGRKY